MGWSEWVCGQGQILRFHGTRWDACVELHGWLTLVLLATLYSVLEIRAHPVKYGSSAAIHRAAACDKDSLAIMGAA
jgi:hypothetical protein